MDTKSFTSLLRKIIREEVRFVVREELKPLLNERKTNHKQVIQHGTQVHRMSETIPYNNSVTPKQTKVATPKQSVKNSMLNDLLNETAMSSAEIDQDWPAMDFRTEMAQAYNGMSSIVPPTDFDHQPVNMSNPAVAATVDAMTRDYSALMKAIDKKKGINK